MPFCPSCKQHWYSPLFRKEEERGWEYGVDATYGEKEECPDCEDAGKSFKVLMEAWSDHADLPEV
jgi:hypothetical protein